MGKKRRMEDDEEEIRRNIRELEQKLKKKKRRIAISSSEEDESESNDSAHSEWQPARRLVSPSPDRRASTRASTRALSQRPMPAPSQQSAPPPSPVPGPSTAVDIPVESTEDPDLQLDDEILGILGDAPQSEVKFGKNIHKDVAFRWQDILSKGLTKETRENLLKEYLVPANCEFLVPPILNPETKAALVEAHVKRDFSLMERQKQIGVALAALSQATEMLISKETSIQKILKPISDASRILCDSHHTDTRIRRNFIISSVDTSMREALLETSRGKYLFGDDITERLKNAKNIQKSGEVLKVQQKNKFHKSNFIKDSQFKNRSNSKALHQRAAGRLDAGRFRPRTRPPTTSGPGSSRQPPRRAADRSPPRRRRSLHR